MTVIKHRIKYLDIAKGFAILFMFTQHCMLVFEYDAGNSENLLSLVFTLLGTAPAAPVFMIIMGVFMMNSKAPAGSQVLRGLKLFGLGYLLNILRLPLSFPDGAEGRGFLLETFSNLMTLNDILQLAGLSMIIGALLKSFLRRRFLPPVLFTAVFIISPFLWGLFPDNPVLLILWGTNENTAFPLFPWIVYPLLGMYLSPYLLSQAQKVDSVLKRAALTGIGLAAAGAVLVLLEIFPLGDYSRSGLGIHLLITGFVLIWMKLCRIIELKSRADGGFLRFMTFLSVNITMIYFIQWILFSWLMLPFGANALNAYAAAVLGAAVFAVTVLLARLKPVKKLFAFTVI